MKKEIIVLIITVGMFLSSCHYQHDELKIVNQSSEAVYYNTYFHKDLEKNDVYNKYNDEYYLDYQLALNPQDSVRPPQRGAWSYNITRISKDSTLSVAFFPKNTIKKFGWDKVILLKKYKIYTYKIKELDSLNWVVEYNGEPNG